MSTITSPGNKKETYICAFLIVILTLFSAQVMSSLNGRKGGIRCQVQYSCNVRE